jgi:FAD/FMN-containing dehydrogenase
MRRVTRREFLRDGAATAVGIGLGLGGRAWLGPSAALAQATAPASALRDLRARLHGTLMLPGDSGYESAYAPANGRFLGIRPMAVARVADEADVITCVAWCVENGVPPVVRAGGHSYAGFSTNEGLVVDIRRLDRVVVDRASGTAVAGGAALNGDFFIATEDGPLFLPGGTCLGVGVGGLTLGGGIGYNAHWAGLTSDRLLASRMVTAAGEVRDIDASQDADLFWACRGGAGGSFGINTEFTFQLVEAPDSVAWYRFGYRGADDAQAVLAAFDRMMQDAPPALNAVAMAQARPVGDGGPREAIDVMTRGQYIGPADELRDLVAPIIAAATPTESTLLEMPFWEAQRMIASTEAESHSWGDISRYADAPLPESVTTRLVDLLSECPSRSDEANGSIWSLGWVGGDVIDAFGRTDTAYVHRGMTTLLRPTTVWPNDVPAAVGEDLDAWTAEVIATLEPTTPHESYQNFPNRAIEDWAEQYYAENLDRLIDIKTAVDPDDLFHNPQSIPTRGS